LPQDLKAFYANHDGMSIEWKFKLDSTSLIKYLNLKNNTSLNSYEISNLKDDITIPLGKIRINSLKELTKVGSVLNKDYSEPSVYDLDDMQDVPKALLVNSSSSHSLSSLSEKLSLNKEEDLNDLHDDLNNVRVIEKFISDEENEEEEQNDLDEIENQMKKDDDEEKHKSNLILL